MKRRPASDPVQLALQVGVGRAVADAEFVARERAEMGLGEPEPRVLRKAKAALGRLAVPQGKRGRRAGVRAAAALIEAQAPGKIGRGDRGTD